MLASTAGRGLGYRLRLWTPDEHPRSARPCSGAVRLVVFLFFCLGDDAAHRAATAIDEA